MGGIDSGRLTSSSPMARRALLSLGAITLVSACSDPQPARDETEELQRQIDAAARNGGGRVKLSGRRYHVTSLALPSGIEMEGASGTALVGLGRQDLIVIPRESHDVAIAGVALHMGAGAAHGALVREDCQRISFRDVSITGHGEGTGIDVRRGCAALTVERCQVSGVSTGIRVLGRANAVHIRDSRFEAWAQRAIALRSKGDEGRCVRIRLERNEIGPCRPGGRIRQPVQLAASGGGYFRDVRVIDNTVRGPGTDDKDQGSSGTADQISLHSSRQFTVSGNVVSSGGEVGITVARGSRDGRVVDNECVGNDSAGIVIGSMTGDRVRNIVVRGNTCKDNGQNHGGHLPHTARSGIAVRNAEEVQVVRNELLSGSQEYGVSIAASVRVITSQNDFNGAQAKAVYRFDKPTRTEDL